MEEMTDDEAERFEEIRNLPPNVIREALAWWNDTAPKDLRMFVIVATYYEYLAGEVESADTVVEDWNKNV